MSDYIKTNWADGDIITAEKLNNMENGIANAGNGVIFIEHKTSSEGSWWEGTTIDPGLGVEDLLKYTWCVIMPMPDDCWTPTPPAIPIQPHNEDISEDTIEIYVAVDPQSSTSLFYYKDTGVIKSRVIND